MKSLKAKFGKFAISSKEADRVNGGGCESFENSICEDDGATLGGSISCTYHSAQYPVPRTQHGFTENQAKDFKRSMEGLGFQVDCR